MTTMAIPQSLNAIQLMQALNKEMAEIIVIPNSWLPERYRQYKEFEVVDVDNQDGTFQTEQVFGRTLGDIEREHARLSQPVVDAAYIKAEKERRIELYAKQYEETGEITYEPPVSQDISKLADILC